MLRVKSQNKNRNFVSNIYAFRVIKHNKKILWKQLILNKKLTKLSNKSQSSSLNLNMHCGHFFLLNPLFWISLLGSDQQEFSDWLCPKFPDFWLAVQFMQLTLWMCWILDIFKSFQLKIVGNISLWSENKSLEVERVEEHWEKGGGCYDKEEGGS